MHEELIKELTTYYKVFESCGEQNSKIAKLLRKSAEVITELDADFNRVPQWVCVDERFPERGKDVLVYAVGKGGEFEGYSVIAVSQRFANRILQYFDFEGEEQWSPPWRFFNQNYEITHWMPLPEGPKNQNDLRKDCRTCKYGKYNDHYGTNFCYDPDVTGQGCIEWSHWMQREEEE